MTAYNISTLKLSCSMTLNKSFIVQYTGYSCYPVTSTPPLVCDLNADCWLKTELCNGCVSCYTSNSKESFKCQTWKVENMKTCKTYITWFEHLGTSWYYQQVIPGYEMTWVRVGKVRNDIGTTWLETYRRRRRQGMTTRGMNQMNNAIHLSVIITETHEDDWLNSWLSMIDRWLEDCSFRSMVQWCVAWHSVISPCSFPPVLPPFKTSTRWTLAVTLTFDILTLECNLYLFVPDCT